MIVYETLPTVGINFDGNPIVVKVKDTGQLSSNTNMACITSIRFLKIFVSWGTLVLTYNSKIYSLKFDGISLPHASQYSSLLTFVTDTFYALQAHSELSELFYFSINYPYIHIIERQNIGTIGIAIDIYYRNDDNTYYSIIESQTAHKINYNDTHRIVIKPMIETTIDAYSLPGGTIGSLFDFMGPEIEIDSDINYIDDFGPFGKISDGTLSIETDIKSLVTINKTGHFSSFADQVVIRKLHNNIQLYSFPRKGIPPVASLAKFSTTIRVINAKTSRTLQAKLNELGLSQWQYMVNNQLFCTSAPNNKTVDVYTPERLTWIKRDATSTIKIMCREYFSDSTTSAARVLHTVIPDIYHFVDFSVALMHVHSSSGKTVVKYDIWIANSADVILSEVRTYLVSYRFEMYAIYWAFKNDWGVYECLRTTGAGIKSAKIEKTFINKELPVNFTSRDSNLQQVSESVEYSIKFSSGPRLKAEAKHFVEMLKSHDVYLIQRDKFIPAHIQPNQFELANDTANLNDIPIEAILTGMYEEEPKYSFILPIVGAFNGDFNESFRI